MRIQSFTNEGNKLENKLFRSILPLKLDCLFFYLQQGLVLDFQSKYVLQFWFANSDTVPTSDLLSRDGWFGVFSIRQNAIS